MFVNHKNLFNFDLVCFIFVFQHTRLEKRYTQLKIGHLQNVLAFQWEAKSTNQVIINQPLSKFGFNGKAFCCQSHRTWTTEIAIQLNQLANFAFDIWSSATRIISTLGPTRTNFEAYPLNVFVESMKYKVSQATRPDGFQSSTISVCVSHLVALITKQFLKLDQ